MRIAIASVVLIVAGVGVGAGRARADAKKDVEAAVKAHLATFGQDTVGGMAKDGKVELDHDELPADQGFNFGAELLGNFSGSSKITVSSITVVVDGSGRAAWFHARATMKYKEVVGEGIDGWAKPQALRLSGVAVDDGGWKIARIAYTKPMADKDLIDGAGYEDPPKPPASGPPARSGDAAIAKAAEAWFAAGGGIVAGASASAQLVANGTAPAEYGAGKAAALKLAKAWDKLKLGATEINAVAYGKVGFVRAVVRWPVKLKGEAAKGKGPLAAEMVLLAIVVDEGGAWKWQSLNWTGY